MTTDMDRLRSKIIFFQSSPKSMKWADAIITTRDLLDQILKEERRKGRAVYLGYEELCKRERCDKFNDRCVPCIKSFWLVEHPEVAVGE